MGSCYYIQSHAVFIIQSAICNSFGRAMRGMDNPRGKYPCCEEHLRYECPLLERWRTLEVPVSMAASGPKAAARRLLDSLCCGGDAGLEASITRLGDSSNSPPLHRRVRALFASRPTRYCQPDLSPHPVGHRTACLAVQTDPQLHTQAPFDRTYQRLPHKGRTHFASALSRDQLRSA